VFTQVELVEYFLELDHFFRKIHFNDGVRWPVAHGQNIYGQVYC